MSGDPCWDFAIPNDANAALPFNMVDRNWEDRCDVSDPNMIVIGPGIHLILPFGQVVWDANPSGLRQSVFWLNGWFPHDGYGGCANQMAVTNTTTDYPCLSGPMEVKEGDRLYFVQKQIRMDYPQGTPVESRPFLNILGSTGTFWGFHILEWSDLEPQ